MNLIFLPFLIAIFFLPASLMASNNSILVQSTTSTKNSGFYDYILPLFEAETRIFVNVVAVGTGAAIKNAMNCDGDVLLVHSPEHEQKFIADGFARHRYDLMYNNFVIVGPKTDPAKLGNHQDARLAFQKIAHNKAKFASRSDNSGTHFKELSIWKKANINPVEASGKWYIETGSGMGTTLNIAIGMRAYTLVDKASWYAYANKHDHTIFVQSDLQLFNPYGVMLIDNKKCPSVKSKEGQIFINWLISKKGQAAISNFRINGKSAFIPNAK